MSKNLIGFMKILQVTLVIVGCSGSRTPRQTVLLTSFHLDFIAFAFHLLTCKNGNLKPDPRIRIIATGYSVPKTGNAATH